MSGDMKSWTFHTPFDVLFCGIFGLQSIVLLNDPGLTAADALECIAAADVFVSSENSFSAAAISISENIRVLTDMWEHDLEEDIIAFSPLHMMRGLELSLRRNDPNWAEMSRMVREYHQCEALSPSEGFMLDGI